MITTVSYLSYKILLKVGDKFKNNQKCKIESL